MREESVQEKMSGILSSVRKGDIIATRTETSPVDFEMDHLKSVEDISRFGAGLRCWGDSGRVGNSYVNSLDDGAVLLKNARDSADFGDAVEFDLPGPHEYPSLPLFRPETAGYGKEKCIEQGGSIIKALKGIDKKCKVEAAVTRSVMTTWLANTSGFYGTYPETDLTVSASMILVEDGGGLLYVGDGDSSYGTDVDIGGMLEKIEWKYKNALKKAAMKKGYCPVIFTPDAAGLLLESVEIAANGKTWFKDVSVLAGKTGQQVFNKKISLTDDPFYSRGQSNYPFDDEGVAPAPLPIIDGGVFKNFIFDLTSARRMGCAPTGHGRRGITSLPSPSFSNMVLAPGDAPLEDMLKSVDYGLFVCSFLGGGMSNMLAGDFSVNVELGYLIEKGRIKGRVKDVMIAGNVFELLGPSSGMVLENKVHKEGSLFAPHVLLEKVSVSG